MQCSTHAIAYKVYTRARLRRLRDLRVVQGALNADLPEHVRLSARSSVGTTQGTPVPTPNKCIKAYIIPTCDGL